MECSVLVEKDPMWSGRWRMSQARDGERTLMLLIGFKLFLVKISTAQRSEPEGLCPQGKERQFGDAQPLRRTSNSISSFLSPWDQKPLPLPAEPWLGCASTRPRHLGRWTGRPPSPGSPPRWSSRCHCGSSPAGPREQHSGRLLGAHGSRPCCRSDTARESGTDYCHACLVLTQWDRLLGGRRPALSWVAHLHRLERGREGVLQGTAGQPPHLLREHGARCHEDVPAGRNNSCIQPF